MIDLTVGSVQPDLRDEPDPDPVIEAATERLRKQLGSLEAVDSWGRPVPWRQVARIALGDLASPRVRDALTADTLAEAVERPVPKTDAVQWQAFLRAIDQSDRLLGDQAGAAPQR